MLKLGEKIISDIYLGDKKIAKVFLGDKLVYQANKPIFLDYIITDGSSYIDTEYCPNENTYIEYTFEVIQKPTASYNGLFGSRQDTTYYPYNVFATSALTFRIDYGKYNETGHLFELNTKYTMKCGNNEIYINDELVKSYTVTYKETSPYSMYLGNLNNKGTVYSSGTPQKIYPCPIYENGVLVRDFRPCIAPNGQVTMYDMVTKKYFYNQGTGTLTAGNVIKFVDYIQFDGDSWIDVDYIPSSNTRVVGKFSITAFKGNGANYVFGVYGDSANFGLNIGSNRKILNIPWASASAVPMDNPNNLGQVYAFDISKNGAYIDGEQKITASRLTATFTATKTFFIGWSNGTSTEKFIGNIYPVQIYENDVLVRDLRPCVIASAVGLYDMVTGKFYTNIGTGELKASGRFVTSILFDGACVVDTGISHQDCTIECDIRFEETGKRQLMGFGSGTGQYWGAGATGIFDYMSGTNALDRTFVTLDFNTTDITVTVNADGVTRLSTKGAQITTLKYRIGAAPTGVSSNAYWCTCEIWSNKAYVNGKLIQDLRPYVDSDGVACFKDLVTGDLFYNKGTGTLGYTE